MPVRKLIRHKTGVVAIHNLTGRPTGVTRRIRTAFIHAAATERKGWRRLDVIIGDDEMLRELNRRHLRFDEPTDVLAFELSGQAGPLEGDIYISLDRVREQAAARGETIPRELLRVAVHGLLHLWGWDHNDDASLQAMIDRGERHVKSVWEFK